MGRDGSWEAAFDTNVDVSSNLGYGGLMVSHGAEATSAAWTRYPSDSDCCGR